MNYVLTDLFCMELVLIWQGPRNFMYKHKLCIKRSRTNGKPAVDCLHPTDQFLATSLLS